MRRDPGASWGKLDRPKPRRRRRSTTAGHNTRIVGGDDAIAELAALRREADGDIGVGGATLATQLLTSQLLDELLLSTQPAVLGAGRPLFDSLDRGGLDWRFSSICSSTSRSTTA
jgi:dihydrofolate reductase